jgi:hypothetical protein
LDSKLALNSKVCSYDTTWPSNHSLFSKSSENKNCIALSESQKSIPLVFEANLQPQNGVNTDLSTTTGTDQESCVARHVARHVRNLAMSLWETTEKTSGLFKQLQLALD